MFCTTPESRRSAVTRPNLELLDDRVMPTSVVGAAQLAHSVAVHVQEVANRPTHVSHHHHNHHQQKAAGLVAANTPSAPLRVAMRHSSSIAASPVITIIPATVSNPSSTTSGTLTTPTTMLPANSTTPANTTATAAITPTPTNPLPRSPAILNQLNLEYQSFIAGGGNPTNFTSNEASRIEVKGNLVGVDISVHGDLIAYETAVAALGMQVQHVNIATGTVEGLVPIDQLAAVTALTGTVSVSPIYRLILSRL